jgi:zinc protease
MSPESLDRTRPPEPGPVRPFDFPAVHRSRLGDGGSPALLTARHGDLPLVTAQVVVEGGAAAESAGQAGIARLTSDALVGGTAAHDEEALAWELESLGVDLDTSAGWDATIVGITVHADRLDPALALLAEVVRRPAFPSDPVDRMRDEQLAEILQRSKEPRALANDAAMRFIFAEDVPYARPALGHAATVDPLGPEELRAFHHDRYRAGSAAVIVAGALDAGRARDAVSRYFGDWHADPVAGTTFDVAPRSPDRQVHIIHRPGAVQSEIRMGHVGVDRYHADYFAVLVMNTILGGAFTSRLNMSLREKHGFTYGARSRFHFRRRPGPFSVDVAVASDVTARAIEEALKEIRGLRDDGPSTEEVDSARDYLQGVLPLKLQTTAQVANRLAQLVIYDLPDDYFDTTRAQIAAVTRDDTLRVARDLVAPDRLAIVIVGDAEQIEAPIRALDLGPITVHQSLP